METWLPYLLALIQCLMAIIGTAAMWWINTTWAKVAVVERQLHLFEVRVAGEYVSNAQLERMLGPITKHLESIESKLDQKADRE